MVEVTPAEAASTAKRNLDGFGFVISDTAYLAGQNATLSISANGFVPQTIELDRDSHERNLTITLEQAPALVQATAFPADSGVKWKIDGNLVGEGGELAVEVEPGTHLLTVSHPYHEEQTASFDLERGAKKTIAFSLKPVQGSIKIFSEPPGAQVILDERPVGETPVSLNRSGGSYRLQLKNDRFVPVTDQVEITSENPDLVRNYRLIYKKARIKLSLSPPGGRLMVDRKFVPTDSPLEVEPLREISISYSKAGYSSQMLKQTFEPDQSVGLSFSLLQEFGEVEIAADPASQISLNGKPAGVTPQTFTLRAVPYIAVLSKEGHRSVTIQFQPTNKHVTRIRKSLKTELEARLNESPEKTSNSIGVELILFDPRSAKMPFVIGAPRGEQGQRANEFLRSVRITRPFYVGSKEISAAQYRKFNSDIFESELPVTDISWDEAAKFCNWLSEKEKLSQFYIVEGAIATGFDSSSDGYRLLSEAEWEWLARYANRQEKTKFVWGNEFVVPARAANLADESAKAGVDIYIPNYNDGYTQAAPIGSLGLDVAGLYDMAGNVSEWVNDVYTLENAAAVLVDPLGAQRGTEHVVKGSSWRSGTLSSLRSSFREGLSRKRKDLGFRIARYIY